MSSTLSKIHVTNSTSRSLNDRFTEILTQPKMVTNIGSSRRSRSRSVQRQLPGSKSEFVTSRANQRLLAQLQRKHKMQAALKLKRRSMRTAGGGGAFGNGTNRRIQRGSVKAFRVGANGKPIRTNSLARIATMKADSESLLSRGRPLRRSNSSGNLANRLGPRRPTVGGAAQRVAKRNLDRQRHRNSNVSTNNSRGRFAANNNRRGRSRSRSRTRTQSGNVRNRSRSRNTGDNQFNNRSRSRNRYHNANVANVSPNNNNNRPSNNNNNNNRPSNNNRSSNNNNNRRGRSRSRSRVQAGSDKANIPIKARLGVRAAATSNRGRNNRGRNASLTRGGVQSGRVQKRRNSTNVNANTNANSRRGRNRSRSVTRNTRNGNVRSGSRSRKGQLGQRGQQGQQGQQGQRNRQAPRGRSLQRRGSNASINSKKNNNGKPQTQQRRGRSRTGRGSNGTGSRKQGIKTNTTTKSPVNKDDLDKELDQYMATTKTENEMDYLLKN